MNCARAFQAATGTDPRFRIRVGIHVGDVLFADNTVLGDGVNLASRIQALAPPGGICISERIYEEIRNKPEFEVQDLGEQQLKNVPRPIRVYALAVPAGTGDRLVHPSKAAAPRASKRIRWVAIAGAVAVAGLIYLAVTLKPSAKNTQVPAPGAPHPIRSIAVLPLDNYSGDPKQEYFAEGMTDELTTDLAKISALRVTSRGSVMQFQRRTSPADAGDREDAQRGCGRGRLRAAGLATGPAAIRKTGWRLQIILAATAQSAFTKPPPSDDYSGS